MSRELLASKAIGSRPPDSTLIRAGCAGRLCRYLTKPMKVAELTTVLEHLLMRSPP